MKRGSCHSLWFLIIFDRLNYYTRSHFECLCLSQSNSSPLSDSSIAFYRFKNLRLFYAFFDVAIALLLPPPPSSFSLAAFLAAMRFFLANSLSIDVADEADEFSSILLKLLLRDLFLFSSLANIFTFSFGEPTYEDGELIGGLEKPLLKIYDEFMTVDYSDALLTICYYYFISESSSLRLLIASSCICFMLTGLLSWSVVLVFA